MRMKTVFLVCEDRGLFPLRIPARHARDWDYHRIVDSLGDQPYRVIAREGDYWFAVPITMSEWEDADAETGSGEE